jgi:hypothetical protein
LVRRAADAFEAAGLAPTIVASFNDSPGAIRKRSAVERAVRKYPHLVRFERDDAPLQTAGIPRIRRLTNVDASSPDDPEKPFPIADLLALADGVPRSLPFHGVSVTLRHADFGRIEGFPVNMTPRTGITITDGWWVNGRTRDLTAYYAVEGESAAKKLPDPPAAVGAILASLGKPQRSAQFVAPGVAAPSQDAAPVPWCPVVLTRQ